MSINEANVAALADEERSNRWNPYFDGDYRPAHARDKKGTSGNRVPVRGNFFRLAYDPDWRMYQYHVDYRPPVESRKMKAALLASHRETIGDVRAWGTKVRKMKTFETYLIMGVRL